MSQLDKVKTVLADGQWHSPEDIAAATSGKPGTVMSRLRDLRTAEFGGLKIEKQSAGQGNGYQYRLAAPRVTMDAQAGVSLQQSTETI